MFGFPDNKQGRAAGIVLASHCHYAGISPIVHKAKFHFFQNQYTKKPEAMLADFESDGGRFDWTTDGGNIEQASITMTHKGKTVSYRFTMDDARRAGLAGKDLWKKYPAQMLRARCISGGMRMHFPKYTEGYYTADEVGDQSEPDSAATSKRPTKAIPSITTPVDTTAVTSVPVALPSPSAVIEVAETKPAEPPTVDAVATPAANPVATPSPSESDEIIDKVALLKKDLGIVSDLSWDAIVEQQGIPVEASSGKRKLRGGTIEQQRGLLAHLVTLNEIKQSVEKLGIADDKWPKVLAKFEIVPVAAHHLCWLSATPAQAATLGHFLTASIAEREKKRTATA
jgi:hypothetical protein